MWEEVKKFFTDGWNFIYAWCVDNQSEALAIAIGCVAGIAAILLITAVVVFFIKKKASAVPYGKDDFVHKVLRYNIDIKNQLLAAAALAFVVTTTICYFAKANPYVTLGFAIATVLALIGRIILDIKVKFSRVEYNNRGLYRYVPFASKPTEIEWTSLKQVLTEGQGSSRVLIFIAKNGKKIRVPMNMEGGYEFGNFCEKQLNGKNFESVKIMQARQ